LNELILGGDGLIGTALIAALRELGHETVSLDIKSGCDLRRPFSLAPFENADRVWFLAWDTGGAKYIEAADQQHEQYKNNCELSLRVFDALARTRTPFLFVTSQLAGVPTAYGITKLMAWRWAEELGGKVARLWNVYGWEQPDVKSHVITDLVLSGLSGQVTCLTQGEERRRFLYKTDCAAALVRLFDGPLQTAEIAGAEWLTIREVAGEIARQLNTGVTFGSLKGSEAPIEPELLLPDWQPEVSLSQGLAKVIEEARRFLELGADRQQAAQK
jgi:nucleoside-diphosphate-sugar epimerase